MDFIDVEMELSAYGRDDLAEWVDAEVRRLRGALLVIARASTTNPQARRIASNALGHNAKLSRGETQNANTDAA